jgi:hypothetical protein
MSNPSDFKWISSEGLATQVAGLFFAPELPLQIGHDGLTSLDLE